MRKSSLATSAMLHLAALIFATITFPFFQKHYDVPPPVQVELVDIAELAQTTKAAPIPAKAEKKPQPEEKKETKKPDPAPTNKSNEAKAPVLKPPEKVEEKKEEKPDEKLVDENAVPQKKPDKKPDKKPEVKKEEPKKDFASILKNLTDTKAPAPPAPNLPVEKLAQNDDGHPLPLGQRMTMTEEDALRKQLEGCWNVPYGAKDAENTTVDIFMVINPDRTLQSARIVDEGRYNSDTFFRAMADSAMRAVRNPNCSPFELPPDKYDAWKTVTVTFDPSQMF